MPLYADLQSQVLATVPNPAELSLREFILKEAPNVHAKLIVVNGHIHNYERFESGKVSYIVSGEVAPSLTAWWFGDRRISTGTGPFPTTTTSPS